MLAIDFNVEIMADPTRIITIGEQAAVGGTLEAMAPYADTFRLLNGIYSAIWIFLLLGFALLARLLARAGEEQLALLAFMLALVTGLTGILHGAFHVGLTTWAAEEAERTGSIPDIYHPLRDWADGAFRLGYGGSFTAMILTGWGILRTGLLPPTLGWVTIGWSALWLIAFLIRAGGAPAMPFIMPAVLGIALLWQPSRHLASGQSEETGILTGEVRNERS